MLLLGITVGIIVGVLVTVFLFLRCKCFGGDDES